MDNEINFFNAETTNTDSISVLWVREVANILLEGTWDTATVKMQVRYTDAGTWVDFMTFTEDDFAIIENLIPGWQIRFNLSSVGAGTSLTVNMINR